MDVSAVLTDAWALYRRFFARLVLTAALVFVPLMLLAAAGTLAGDEDAGRALAAGLALVLGLLGLYYVQAPLTEAVADVRDGRADVPVGELYARTRPRALRVVAGGMLASLGIGAGLLAVLPGGYLLGRWALVVPVLVLERTGIRASFGRSHQLVRGQFWNVFGLAVTTLIAAWLAVMVLLSFSAWLPEFLAAWLGPAVAYSLVVPFAALVWTLMYFRLAEPSASGRLAAPATA